MFFESVSATSRVTRSRIFDREQELLAQGQAHRERLFRFYMSDKGQGTRAIDDYSCPSSRTYIATQNSPVSSWRMIILPTSRDRSDSLIQALR